MTNLLILLEYQHILKLENKFATNELLKNVHEHGILSKTMALYKKKQLSCLVDCVKVNMEQ